MIGMNPPVQTPVPLPPMPQHSASARPAQYAQSQQAGHVQSYGTGYSQSPAPVRYQPMGTPGAVGYNVPHSSQAARPVANQPQPGHHANAYNPPRPPEVYTLPDSVNEALPSLIRDELQRDKAGRVLFFTAPPSDRPSITTAPEKAGLGHSLRYLAGREDWFAQRDKKRKARDELASREPRHSLRPSDDTAREQLSAQATGALHHWLGQIGHSAEQWKHETGLSP